MATTVDNRIVEIEFRNREFEKNVQESLETLKRLEKALDLEGATKGIQQLDRDTSSSLSNISKSVDDIGKRFTLFGNFQQSIFKDVVGLAKNAANSIIGYITKPYEIAKSKGWTRAMNIENAKFQLEGLGIAWDKVSDSINYAVDGTAYGLDSAAKAAGQLAASGVSLGEDMSTALRAISGTAAMANTSYDEMADIFEAAAGKGRLMGMELTRLSQKGIGAASILGKYLGKSEADVRDMASKSQISFKMFAEAMDDAFGEHAKDANATFEGSLSNINAALGRIGALFTTPLIQNAPEVFNAIRIQVNGVKAALEPVGKAFDDLVVILAHFAAKTINSEKTAKILNNVLTATYNIFESLIRIISPITAAFQNIFPRNFMDVLSEITDKFAKFTEKLKINQNVSKLLYDVFNALFSIIKFIGEVIGALIKIMSPIVDKYLKPIINTTLSLIDVIAIVITRVIEMTSASELVDKFASSIVSTFDWLSKNLGPIVNLLFNAFLTHLKTVAALITVTLTKLKSLSNVDLKFKFIQSVKTAIENLKNILELGFNKINEFVGKFEFPTFSQICEKLKEGFDMVGSGVGAMTDGLKNAATNVWNAMQKIISSINFGKETVVNLWNGLQSFIKDIIGLGMMVLFGKFVYELTSTTKKLGNVIGSLSKTIGNIGGLFKELERGVRYDNAIKIASAIAIITSAVIALAHVPVEDLGKAVAAITLIFAELMIAIGGISAFSAAVEKLTRAKEIKKVGDSVSQQINNVGQAISTSTSGLIGSFKGVFTSLSSAIKTTATSLGKVIESSIKNVSNAASLAVKMLSLAASILILAKALKEISDVIHDKSFDTAVQSLIAVGALMGGIVLSSILISKLAKGVEDSAIFIVVFAGALKILVDSLQALAAYKFEQIAAPLVELGLVAAALVIVSKQLNKIEINQRVNANLIVLTGCMVILLKLAQSIQTIEQLEMIAAAAIELGVIAATLVIAARSLNKIEINKGIIPTLATLVLAFDILAGTLNKLANIDKNYVAAVGSLASTALILVGTMKILSTITKPEALASLASSLLTLSVALGIMSGMVVLFGTIMGSNANIIATGLSIMAAELLVLGGLLFAGAATGLAPQMLLIADAVMKLNLGFLAGAAGVGVFAVAFGLLVAALTTGATLIVASGATLIAAVQVLLAAILSAIVNLKPLIMAAIAAIIEGAALVVAGKAIVIATAVVLVINKVLEVLDKYSPTMFEHLMNIIDNLLLALSNHAESITNSLIKILYGIFTGVVTGILKYFPIAFLKIKSAINEFITQYGEDIKNAVSKFFEGIKESIDEFIESTFGGFITLATNIGDHVGNFFEGGKNLIKGMIDGADSEKKNFSDKIREISEDGNDELLDYWEISSPSARAARETENIPAGAGKGVERAADLFTNSMKDLGTSGMEVFTDTVEPLIANAGAQVPEIFNVSVTENSGIVKTGADVLAKMVGDNLSEKGGVVGKAAGFLTSDEFAKGLVGNDGAISAAEFFGSLMGEGVYDGAAPYADKLDNLFRSIFDENWRRTAKAKAESEKAGLVSIGDFRMLENGLKSVNGTAKETESEMKEVASTTDSAGKKAKSSGGSASKAAKETKEELKKLFSVTDSAGPILASFSNKFSKAFENLDTNSKFSLQSFRYNFSGSSKEISDIFQAMQDNISQHTAAMNAEIAKGVEMDLDKMASLRDEYMEKSKSLYAELGETIKTAFITKSIENFADIILRTSDKYTDEIRGMSKDSKEYFAAMQEAWDDYYKSMQEKLNLDLFSENTRSFSANLNDITKRLTDNKKYIEDYDKTMERLSLRFASNNWDTTVLKIWADEGYAAFDKVAGAMQATDSEVIKLIKAYQESEQVLATVTDSVISSLAIAMGGWGESVEGTIELNDEYRQSLNLLGDAVEDISIIVKNRYEEMYQAISKVLDDQINVFKEYAEDEEDSLTKADLKQYAQSQKKHMKDYADVFTNLINKGLPDQLVGQLMNMGDEGYKIMKAMNTMTEQELTEYTTEIAEIMKMKEEFAKSISLSYATTGEGAVKAFANAIQPGEPDQKTLEMVRKCVNTLTTESAKSKEGASVFIGNFREGIQKNTDNTNNTVKIFSRDVLAELKKDFPENTLNTIGKQVVQGFANGLTENSRIAEHAIQTVISRVKKKAEQEAEVASPSKWGIRVGKYIDEGLGGGISDNEDIVVDAMGNLTNKTFSAMESVVNHIYEILDGDLDLDPTIRPIVDLSDINDKTSYINSLFAADRTSRLAHGINITPRYAQNDETLANGTVTTNQTSPVNIYVYGAPGQDVSELADYVQNKVNRAVRRGI